MKIPKEAQDLLNERERLAMDLMSVSCNNLQNELEDASPYSLVDMVDRNVEISED